MKIIEVINNKNDFKIQGIYAIVNKVNWKVYVGQAHIGKKYSGIGERFYDHKRKLKKGKHFNSHLQYSWNKYGCNNFIYIILEKVDNLDDLIYREQFWIDKFQSYNKCLGYNICAVAGSVRGIKYSKEVLEKFKMAQMKRPPQKHKYKGVCHYKNQWLASFNHFSIGVFNTIEEAAKNYDYHVIQLYNKDNDCYLNFPNFDYSNFIPKRKKLFKHVPTSSFVGVSKYKGKWRAFSSLNSLNKHIGIFPNEEDAAKHYDYHLIQNKKKPINFPKHDYSSYKPAIINRMTRMPKNSYKGITYYKKNKQWGARISFNGKSYFIGIFQDEKEAAKHYDYYVLKLHGEKSYLNFPKFDYSNFTPIKILLI
jgi:group I intron endonuclease